MMGVLENSLELSVSIFEVIGVILTVCAFFGGFIVVVGLYFSGFFYSFEWLVDEFGGWGFLVWLLGVVPGYIFMTSFGYNLGKAWGWW